MKIRQVAQPRPPVLIDSRAAVFCLLVLLSAIATGCGAPGQPEPPSPPIPVAVSDLAAQQFGDAALLDFTLPNKSTRGVRLTEVPTLEVWRGSLRADGTPDSRSFHLVDTVPAAILGTYVQEGKVSYPEPVPLDDLRTPTGEKVVYRVSTRVSARKASANSNAAIVELRPVPQRIEDVAPKVTEKSIQLSWTSPTTISAGAPLPRIEEFHVYRGELDPASAAAAEKDLHDAVWKMPLAQIGVSPTPEYQDSAFDFGRTYAYVVRTVIREAGVLVESGYSRPAIVTPKDIFPPAVPQDVVAVVVPSTNPWTYAVDLSWAINVETDLAGYRVYRSESENVNGPFLTPELLPTPSFRDNQVVPGHRYWYSVTAVDRAGNESAPSAAAVVDIP
jgi:hypothetical protein